MWFILLQNILKVEFMGWVFITEEGGSAKYDDAKYILQYSYLYSITRAIKLFLTHVCYKYTISHTRVII